MEHCPFPIEVCEAIIDTSAYGQYGNRGMPEQCAALRACALTCRAWLPRSLINLYHTVILSGDERTRNVVKSLRGLDNSIAINVRAVEIHIVLDSVKKQDNTPPPYHLVPYLLASLPQVIRSVETVIIFSLDGDPIFGGPTHGSDIFLKSYGYFQSVQTLNLSGMTFDTFSYFARLITCFRALRHLHLSWVEFLKLNDHPAALAKLKRYKLHTLTVNYATVRYICHLARWLLKADACSLLESLSHRRVIDESTSDSDACISDMMAAAGASLKHLALGTYSSSNIGVDCSSSTSLQTIHLEDLAANSATSILSTISSQDLSTMQLETIGVDGIADVDALAAILVSKQFTSLPKLNHIHVKIRPTRKWHDRLAGTVEERRRVVGTEIDGPISKLRGVFRERLETCIDWSYCY